MTSRFDSLFVFWEGNVLPLLKAWVLTSDICLRRFDRLLRLFVVTQNEKTYIWKKLKMDAAI